MSMGKKIPRVAGLGSLWRCMICDVRTRAPEEHWTEFHLDIKPFSLQIVWDCFALMSNARKSQMPAKVEPLKKAVEPRLW